MVFRKRENGLYQGNLNSPAVRVVEVAMGSSPATSVWAVYDRSLEPKLPPVYPLDTIIHIRLEAEDIYANEIIVECHEFKVESDKPGSCEAGKPGSHDAGKPGRLVFDVQVH